MRDRERRGKGNGKVNQRSTPEGAELKTENGTPNSRDTACRVLFLCVTVPPTTLFYLFLPCREIRGTSISSRLMPPCWKVSR